MYCIKISAWRLLIMRNSLNLCSHYMHMMRHHLNFGQDHCVQRSLRCITWFTVIVILYRIAHVMSAGLYMVIYWFVFSQNFCIYTSHYLRHCSHFTRADSNNILCVTQTAYGTTLVCNILSFSWRKWLTELSLVFALIIRAASRKTWYIICIKPMGTEISKWIKSLF